MTESNLTPEDMVPQMVDEGEAVPSPYAASSGSDPGNTQEDFSELPETNDGSA